MSRVLVYQSNSVQGRPVLEFSRQSGYTTRALIRDATIARSLRESGFEVAIADFLDEAALIKAHESVDYVIAQIPAYSDSFAQRAIVNSIRAMKHCSVRGVILKMANPTPTAQKPDTGFSTNSIVISKLGASHIPHSIVEPTMYLDTFLKPNLSREISLQNLIDLPIDSELKVAWTCVEDAARLAISLLKESAFGTTVRCEGENAYSGLELAEIFSATLGRNITFKSAKVDIFQSEIEAAIGVENAKMVVSKFRFLEQRPEQARKMFRNSSDGNRWFRPTKVKDWIESKRQYFTRSD